MTLRGSIVKIKKYDTTIQVKLEKEVKEQAEAKLASMNYSISEYVREKLKELEDK